MFVYGRWIDGIAGVRGTHQLYVMHVHTGVDDVRADFTTDLTALATRSVATPDRKNKILELYAARDTARETVGVCSCMLAAGAYVLTRGG